MHRTQTAVPRTSTGLGLGALLAVTIFVSAFLLFQVQPLISKFILPWFGGSPAVWTTAMLFFQCVLFCGYTYSHLTSTYLGLHRQTQLHIGLLIVAALMAWFVIPMDSLKPTGEENPTLKILMLLGVCVGLPYFMLSTTGPLIQAWYSRAYPGESPYRLFALSNFGSLLALASFPFVFEPNLDLPSMGRFWMVGFWVFASICTYAASRVLWLHLDRAKAQTETPVVEEHAAPPLREKLAWVGLPAIASLVFIATSNHVCHNVAPTPFLWIVPLGLYLVTFIVCFDHERWYRRVPFAMLCAAAILLLLSYDALVDWAWDHYAYETVSPTWERFFSSARRDTLLHLDLRLSFVQDLMLYFGTMFLMCMICHGELVKLKPRNHKYLTEFFLCISAGGALGGLFISFVAVNLFNDYYEWSLGLIACLLIACGVLGSAVKAKLIEGVTPARVAAGIGVFVLTFAGTIWGVMRTSPNLLDQQRVYRDEKSGATDVTTYQARNFYGRVQVRETRYDEPTQGDDILTFRSGGIIHGAQLLDPVKRKTPIAYYHPESGSGRTIRHVLDHSPQRKVKFAVVGLGAGSLAAFARVPEGDRPADECVMYEINPLVEEIARQRFFYLSDYEDRTKTPIEVRLGDARLTMEREAPQDYDVIFLDAFSGDSVPAHLLTKEAFEIYQKHLRKNADGTPAGCIVLNITNSYLNLYPVVKNAAEKVMGMKFTSVYKEADRKEHAQRTHYFVITNDDALLAALPMVPRYLERKDAKTGAMERYAVDYDWPGIPLWTDHYSNLFQIILND